MIHQTISDYTDSDIQIETWFLYPPWWVGVFWFNIVYWFSSYSSSSLTRPPSQPCRLSWRQQPGRSIRCDRFCQGSPASTSVRAPSYRSWGPASSSRAQTNCRQSGDAWEHRGPSPSSPSSPSLASGSGPPKLASSS